jgi:hypothetical protein
MNPFGVDLSEPVLQIFERRAQLQKEPSTGVQEDRSIYGLLISPVSCFETAARV